MRAIHPTSKNVIAPFCEKSSEFDANSEDKWAIFKNVHEPIIDREVFEQVQKLIGKTRRRNPKSENWERNMFCDLLYCADCRRKLWFNISTIRKIYRSLCAAIITITGELAAQPIISEPTLLSRW